MTCSWLAGFTKVVALVGGSLAPAGPEGARRVKAPVSISGFSATPRRAGLILVPGASGRVGEPGEVPDHGAGAGAWRQDEFIPVLLGPTLTTELPTLMKAAIENPEVTVSALCGGSLVLRALLPRPAGELVGVHSAAGRARLPFQVLQSSEPWWSMSRTAGTRPGAAQPVMSMRCVPTTDNSRSASSDGEPGAAV